MVLQQIKGKLIVSCQALENEPLYGLMDKVAQACIAGGAGGIRANGVHDINAIKKITTLPVIGLIKKSYFNSEVYITPTTKEVLALLETGCEIIAVDATMRKRPNDEKLTDLVALIHKHHRYALADISTLDEAIDAEKIGFDLVATTLSGYTSYSRKLKGPDIKLVKECTKHLNIGVIAEGRISEIKDLQKILKYKPFAVVIGSAITRPQIITQKYAQYFQ